jgi:capsular exopolysaccharide synthesis family protein
VSARFLLSVVGRWWRWGLPAALLLAAVSGGLVWYFFEPVYEATAWLQIEDRAPYIAFESQEESKRFVETQTALLRSPLVLGPVVSRPEVARLSCVRTRKDPIAWLGKKVRVEPLGDSELFKVSFQDRRADDAAIVVNAVVTAYFKLRSEDSAARARRVLELLDQEKDRRFHELGRLREKVRQQSQQLLASDPLAVNSTGDVLVLNHPLKELQQRLAQAEVDGRLLEAQVQALEEVEAEGVAAVPDAVLEKEIRGSDEWKGLAELIAKRRATMQQIATSSVKGVEDPSYQRLAREVARFEDQLEELRQSARPRIGQQLAAVALLEKKDELARLKSTRASHKLMEQLLRTRYEDQLKELGQTGSQSLDLEFARSELAREEQVFDMIAQRATSLRTEMRAPGRVSLMQPADQPEAPVEEIPWKYLALSVLISFGLPFGVAAGWEKSIRRITGAEDIEQQLEVPVVGEVSRLPRRRAQDVPGHARGGYDTGVYEESIDSLRVRLVLADDHHDVQVLAVTSAVASEGKTSVASQLAVSLARACGKPTLLIDGDLRSPDIHRLFQIPRTPGLAAVLEQQSSLEAAIVTTWSDDLHLLPAGELGRSPHKLLGEGAFKKILDEARLWYHYIVVDTPPVLAASEALVLAKDADATLVCAMNDVSRAGQLRHAYNRLVSAGARPLGAVLSGISLRRYTEKYGSYDYGRKAC